MKKVIVIIVAAAIVTGAVIGGGYYWYKKRNEPPQTIEYRDIGEVDRDIARLEPLDKAGRLSWQDKYLLGVVYLQRGRMADAAKTLEDVTRLHANFYKVYESLGMAYYRMNDMEKAISIWERAVKMSPQAAHLEDMINRGKQKIEFGKRILTLEQEVKDSQADWQKKFELAALYFAVNRVDDAKARLEEIIKVKKDSPEAYDAIAHAYAISGDFEKAVNAEKRAVKLMPSNEQFKKRLAELERVMKGMKKGGHHKK